VNYNNFPYGIFNQSTLTAQEVKQLQAQRAWEQNKNIADMVKALSDYFKAARKVDPDYQNAAIQACLSEIMRQMAMDNGGQR
jgi:DNA-directed RNA polymerase subunit F